MIDARTTNGSDGTWIDRFEGLNGLPAPLRDDLGKGSRTVSVAEGTRIFRSGQAADNLLLVLEGTVRVQQTAASGREMVLYRVHAGESCVLTTACMLASENYAAEGIAETATTAAAIPRKVFDDLVARSSVFREFVFAAYARRITDLFHLIEEVVFTRMDVRLATLLLASSGEAGIVRSTHARLALELSTAREVVSRTLSEFQRQGLIEQARGAVRIVHREGLEALAHA